MGCTASSNSGPDDEKTPSTVNPDVTGESQLEQECPPEVQAATRIQAAFRGHKARRTMSMKAKPEPEPSKAEMEAEFRADDKVETQALIFTKEQAPELYQRFIVKFGRKFKSQKEYQFRFNNFLRTLEVINQINSKPGALGSVMMIPNAFADWSEIEKLAYEKQQESQNMENPQTVSGTGAQRRTSQYQFSHDKINFNHGDGNDDHLI